MRNLILIFVMCICKNAYTQHQNIELNHQHTRWLDKAINQTNIHSSCKPLMQSDISFDSLTAKVHKKIGNQTRKKKFFNYVLRKAFDESFIILDTTNFKFVIEPLGNIGFGWENSPDALTKDLQLFGIPLSSVQSHINTRGIRVNSSIGKTISFSTAFYENQSLFPSFVRKYAFSLGQDNYPGSGLVPGQGRAKPSGNEEFDYGIATAYLNFVPSNRINIRTGHGKHFIGEGYRSILLSDNAFNYPYLRLTYTLGKKNRFQYTNLFASLLENERVPVSNMPEAPFIKKGMTIHYLNYLPNSWFQIGLFESTIWKQWDEENLESLPFNFKLFNPIVGINYLTNINSTHNSSFGLNLKLSLKKYLSIYGQLIGSSQSQFGSQFGVKIFDFFTLIPNLNLQFEMNQRGFTNNLAYLHYGQSIGHFAIGNFQEWIAICNYNLGRFYLLQKVNYLFLNQENWDTPVFTYEQVINFQTEFSYLFNPKSNLNLFIGVNQRIAFENNSSIDSKQLYLGFRTSLRNLYYDF